MNILRVILTVLLVPAFVLLVRGVGSRSRALRGVALLASVGAAGLIINFPGLLDRSARELGINSGADLTLYLSYSGCSHWVDIWLENFAVWNNALPVSSMNWQ